MFFLIEVKLRDMKRVNNKPIKIDGDAIKDGILKYKVTFNDGITKWVSKDGIKRYKVFRNYEKERLIRINPKLIKNDDQIITIPNLPVIITDLNEGIYQ